MNLVRLLLPPILRHFKAELFCASGVLHLEGSAHELSIKTYTDFTSDTPYLILDSIACPESPRLATEDFDSSSSSSDEEEIDNRLPPVGLFAPPKRWTAINADEPSGPLDSDYWDDGINPGPLPRIEEEEFETERSPKIVPMAKHIQRVQAVQQRRKQTLPAIFRHRVYTRSPLARETVLAHDHKTGRTIMRYGVHLGRGIIGDWSPNDGFQGDWRTVR